MDTTTGPDHQPTNPRILDTTLTVTAIEPANTIAIPREITITLNQVYDDPWSNYIPKTPRIVLDVDHRHVPAYGTQYRVTIERIDQ